MRVQQIERLEFDNITNYVLSHMRVILGVFALLLILGLGFIYNNHLKSVKLEQANYIYDNILEAIEEDDLFTAKAQVALLKTRYAATVYSQLAYLIEAKFAVDEKQYDLAVNILQQLIKDYPKSDFTPIAQIRTARILIYLGRYTDAIKILDNMNAKDKKDYAYLASTLKGDVDVKQNNIKAAKEAYRNALAETKMPYGFIDPFYLNMKNNSLAEF